MVERQSYLGYYATYFAFQLKNQARVLNQNSGEQTRDDETDTLFDCSRFARCSVNTFYASFEIATQKVLEFKSNDSRLKLGF